jgi:hypothetical protein
MVEIEKRYPKIVCVMKKIENSYNNSTDNGDENYLQPCNTVQIQNEVVDWYQPGREEEYEEYYRQLGYNVDGPWEPAGSININDLESDPESEAEPDEGVQDDNT